MKKLNLIIPFIPIFGFIYLIATIKWQINDAEVTILDDKKLSRIFGILQGLWFGILIALQIFN